MHFPLKEERKTSWKVKAFCDNFLKWKRSAQNRDAVYWDKVVLRWILSAWVAWSCNRNSRKRREKRRKYRIQYKRHSLRWRIGRKRYWVVWQIHVKTDSLNCRALEFRYSSKIVLKIDKKNGNFAPSSPVDTDLPQSYRIGARAIALFGVLPLWAVNSSPPGCRHTSWPATPTR